MSSPQMRFSDQQLQEFHTEFKEHVAKYEERQQKHEECVYELVKAQQKNTEAIATLIEDTRQIVQLHRDLQGATRIGASMQRFGFWVLKWSALGSALAAAYHYGLQFITEAFK